MTIREESWGAYLSQRRVGSRAYHFPFFIQLETSRFFKHPPETRGLEIATPVPDVLPYRHARKEHHGTDKIAKSENRTRLTIERKSKYRIVFFLLSFLRFLISWCQRQTNSNVRVMILKGVKVIFRNGFTISTVREIFQRDCRQERSTRVVVYWVSQALLRLNAKLVSVKKQQESLPRKESTVLSSSISSAIIKRCSLSTVWLLLKVSKRRARNGQSFCEKFNGPPYWILARKL